MGDVIKLLTADLFEMLALGAKLLVNLDGFFDHLLMGLLSAPQEGEILSSGDSLVTIRVQTHSNHEAFLLIFFSGRLRHDLSVDVKHGNARRNQGTGVWGRFKVGENGVSPIPREGTGMGRYGPHYRTAVLLL